MMSKPANMMGKMVFLTGPATRGDSEFAVLTMLDYNLGVIVGERTAGAPAMAAIGVLPGGLEIAWTGIESRSLSGEEIFAHGVPPNVEAPRTRRPLAAGRDDAIDAAVRTLDEIFEAIRGEIDAPPEP